MAELGTEGEEKGPRALGKVKQECKENFYSSYKSNLCAHTAQFGVGQMNSGLSQFSLPALASVLAAAVFETQ